ncbi:hypothetical protein B7486_69525 [cyanobacterium TDX16]|nr:hypothetical protein B7486_69525 [cyanobacterium TDX16]
MVFGYHRDRKSGTTVGDPMTEFFLMEQKRNDIFKKLFLASVVKFSIGKLLQIQRLYQKIQRS